MHLLSVLCHASSLVCVGWCFGMYFTANFLGKLYPQIGPPPKFMLWAGALNIVIWCSVEFL